MTMQMMEFHGFRWPQNPASLSVSHRRQIKEHMVPYQGGVLQDFGRRNMVASGEGVLQGSRAMEQFQRLSRFYTDGVVGVLKLPGLPPVMAKLVELELLPKIVPDKVRYRFVFWEDPSASLPEESLHGPGGGFVTAADGDNLWQIANEHHTAVEVLLSLNPAVQWPGYLAEGQQVMLP